MDRYRDPNWLRSESHVDAAGVTRWNSNDRVPFDDVLTVMGLDADAMARCRAARDKDNAASIAEYKRRRANRPQWMIDEERAEARAAMGPGVEMINVLTGERYTT